MELPPLKITPRQADMLADAFDLSLPYVRKELKAKQEETEEPKKSRWTNFWKRAAILNSILR